ncbi:MAG: hypothetical protein ABI743_01665 [bacterium]
MPDFSFILDPLTRSSKANDGGAPRPEEIEGVLRQWRREGLAVDLPKNRSKEARRRESAFRSALEEFPIAGITEAGVYQCPKCQRTVTLRALEKRQCTECGGELVEQRTSKVIQVGDSIGARFESITAPTFHLSVDALIRTLDLPRWFLDLGPHTRESRRIPVNLANFGIAAGLCAAIPFTLLASVLSWTLEPGMARNLWRSGSVAGGIAIVLLLILRPILQTYVIVGRDKIMATILGQRHVLHFQNIEEIRNDRRLTGYGYALVLGRRWGKWAQWLYAGIFQWIDPRAWFGWYPAKAIDGLPPELGGAASLALRNRIILKGERRVLKLPYNGLLRHDLTQALAVVVFQVRSMSPKARIDLTALQAAQRERSTTEQWAAGLRH